MGTFIRRTIPNGQPKLAMIALFTFMALFLWASRLSGDVKESIVLMRKLARIDESNNVLSEPLKLKIALLNKMGKRWSNFNMFENLMGEHDSIVMNMQTRYQNILAKAANSPLRRSIKIPQVETTINVAAVACNDRREEFITMLKSAMLFSHYSDIHFIVFSDEYTIVNAALDLLELKWTFNALGWDFSYELHLEWFPNDGRNWREMYTPCATQRLFFPTLLPHIDSLIYIDSDVVVLSNLTEFWLEFPRNMKDKKFAAMASNNEITANGWYNTVSQIPHYGPRGLNAGIMMMNLTQMREFNFQNRAMAAQVLYDGKIALADQDIVNIIFHGFPERLHQLPCSYNFNWVYCGAVGMGNVCKNEYCFCNATFTNGVQLLHGNSGTFYYPEALPFAADTYKKFHKFNLLTDSPADLIDNLFDDFTRWTKPCGPLTADIMFRNAENYLSKVYPQLFLEN